jgi:hypothetical protein
MYRAQEAIHAEVGQEKLDRAGELGVLRLMLKYEPWFFSLLAVPTFLVPGRHAREPRPSDAYLKAGAVSAECPAAR